MGQDTANKEKKYTAFGVTGGIVTMLVLFIIMLICKYGGIIFMAFPEFIKSIKGLFGG